MGICLEKTGLKYSHVLKEYHSNHLGGGSGAERRVQKKEGGGIPIVCLSENGVGQRVGSDGNGGVYGIFIVWHQLRRVPPAEDIFGGGAVLATVVLHQRRYHGRETTTI